jgi:hypothetical protein
MGLSRPVWIDLQGLYRLPVNRVGDDALLPRLGQELHLEGEVAGTLHEWTRSARGLWLGVVSFAVPLAHDRSQRLELRRQLVPAYALRPRSAPPYRSR